MVDRTVQWRGFRHTACVGYVVAMVVVLWVAYNSHVFIFRMY